MYKLHVIFSKNLIQGVGNLITKKLAEEIVQQTMFRLNRNLNVMDTNGMILASGEAERIDRIHEGAAYVAKTKVPIWITDDNLKDWHGTKPGVNMPVYYKEQLVGVIGITGTHDELKDVATLVQLTTEMMIHQSFITSEVEWKRKMKELIFEELLEVGPLSTIVVDRLSALNFKMTGPYLTILVQTKDLQQFPLRLTESIEELFERNTALLGHSQFNQLFIVLSDLKSSVLGRKISNIHQLLHTDYSVEIGVGLYVEDLQDIKHSYETAKLALTYGNAHESIHYYDAIELIALLKTVSVPMKERLSKRVLAGLNDQLIDTLEAFFENDIVIGATADALAIHRHTLTYRLRKVKELTTLDPVRFQDALLFYIAIILRKA